MNFTKSYTGLEAQLICVCICIYLLKTSLYHREFRYLNNEGIAQEDSIYRVSELKGICAFLLWNEFLHYYYLRIKFDNMTLKAFKELPQVLSMFEVGVP